MELDTKRSRPGGTSVLRHLSTMKNHNLLWVVQGRYTTVVSRAGSMLRVLFQVFVQLRVSYFHPVFLFFKLTLSITPSLLQAFRSILPLIRRTRTVYLIHGHKVSSEPRRVAYRVSFNRFIYNT
jgi:hypothetical protein